ncbi:MAG: hydrolase, partial [Nocardia sp.]|nr:hydrolase [Nocardia sp.]
MQPQQPPADGAPESAEPLRATASALGAPGPRAAADAAASDQTNTAATSDIPIPEGAGTDIAVVQFDPYTDKDANLAALRAQCLRAVDSGAKVVVAPEYSMFAVKRLDQRAVDAAEPLDGPWVSGLRALATESGAHVVAGVVESPAADDSVRIYNTLVAAGPDGEIATIYRKVHLYDAFGFRESEVVVPGPIADPATFTVDGVVLGLQTCFDLRFPEGFRRVAAAGAHVLVV